MCLRCTVDVCRSHVSGLQELGKNWAEVAGCVGSKTAAQCKRFYRTQRQKLDLDDLIASEATIVFFLCVHPRVTVTVAIQ